ncbi:MAG: phosphoribosyltransferase-like protein [Methyloceanibacter sp.]
MRTPKARGTPVSQRRQSAWLKHFGAYRIAVTAERLSAFLGQFSPEHVDAAARVLDVVEFFGPERIGRAFQNVLGRLPGWHIHKNKRVGRWYFAAFSSSAGESGDTMLHRFRQANGLDRSSYDSLFVYKRDLLVDAPTSDDSVVFVDDFSATGDQAVGAWNDTLRELLPDSPKTYLVLAAVSRAAKERIVRDTQLKVYSPTTLMEEDNILGGHCNHFSAREREALLDYCVKADEKRPRGYGDCGFVVVFAHGCPNNSIPILHRNHGKWRGLFPRDAR